MLSSSLARLARLAAASLALLGLSLTSSAASASAFDTVYAFGDSLSDNGNIFAASGYPPAPYYQGRFSNGPVAVEYLAQGLGAQLHDYAYGGATTGLYNADLTPADGPLYATGLQSQVAAFAASPPPGPTGSSALYVVWAGPNDFLSGNPLTYPSIAATAIGNLTSSVSSLYAAGARNFLLPLMPDLGATPSLVSAGSLASSFASQASQGFDQALAGAYQLLAQALPGSHFTIFDTFAAQGALIADAAAHGLSNTTEACVTATSLCANPASYFYWDDVHPTTGVHQVLAAEMIAAVPEPGSIAMMALGLVVLLGVARRRSVAAVPTAVRCVATRHSARGQAGR